MHLHGHKNHTLGLVKRRSHLRDASHRCCLQNPRISHFQEWCSVFLMWMCLCCCFSQLFTVNFGLKKSWQVAREDCLARGADLVSIHSPEEEIFLSSYSKGKTKWIGLSVNPLEGGSSARWCFTDHENGLYWDRAVSNLSSLRLPLERWDAGQSHELGPW